MLSLPNAGNWISKKTKNYTQVQKEKENFITPFLKINPQMKLGIFML